MKTVRAWVRLSPSGRQLNLLDPDPDAWNDADLAVGLSRTYRWGGHSAWDLPLSVAQHSLTVLAIRQAQPGAKLTRGQALRERLHDADEGFLSFDCITPVKPYLGDGYASLVARLQAAIVTRYQLPAWSADEHAQHKQADRLAAASEALNDNAGRDAGLAALAGAARRRTIPAGADQTLSGPERPRTSRRNGGAISLTMRRKILQRG